MPVWLGWWCCDSLADSPRKRQPRSWGSRYRLSNAIGNLHGPGWPRNWLTLYRADPALRVLQVRQNRNGFVQPLIAQPVTWQAPQTSRRAFHQAVDFFAVGWHV